MKNSIFSYLIVGLFIAGCKPTPDPELKALTDKLENPDITYELAIANYEHTARSIVAESPEVKSLIAKGETAAKYVTAKFDEPTLSNRDYSLASYAYVIEVVKYRKALPTLNKFLAEPQNRRTLNWAIVFAEHARKVLEVGSGP